MIAKLVKTQYSRGLTLLELLVSLVILTMIVTSTFVAFNAGKSSWQVGETMMEKYQNARGALEFISREISAICYVYNSVYQSGVVWSGGSNDFVFIASVPSDDHTGDWDLCKIGYRYDSTEREIERAFDVPSPALPDLTDSMTSWQPLVSNVNSLSFVLFDADGSEATSWNSAPGGSNEGKLPSAVEITLAVRDEKQLAEERTFRTLAYIAQSKQND